MISNRVYLLTKGGEPYTANPYKYVVRNAYEALTEDERLVTKIWYMSPATEGIFVEETVDWLLDTEV